MAEEYTPELQKSILDNLLRQIEEEKAKNISVARGESVTRGLPGGGFEAKRISAAETTATNKKADTMVSFAMENATRLREERLIKEQRDYEGKIRTYQAEQQALQNTFNSTEAKLNRDWQELENAKNIAAQAGEAEKVRQYQSQQDELNRQYQESMAQHQQKMDLLNAGIQTVGQSVGTVAGYKMASNLFKSPATGNIPVNGTNLVAGTTNPVTGAVVNTATQPTGNMFTSFGTANPTMGARVLGGAVGTGIGLVEANNLFKSDTAKNRARTGTLVGTGVGSFLGPVGSVVGGAAGSAIGGLTANKSVGKAWEQFGFGNLVGAKGSVVNSIAKSVKNIFCFDVNTEILMKDETVKKMKDVELGDETKGGRVLSIRIAIAEPETVCFYKGVYVTKFHAVFEKDRWIRVKDAEGCIQLPDGRPIVSIATTEHRIYTSNGIMFADELETDNYENLTIDGSLHFLNEELEKKELCGVN